MTGFEVRVDTPPPVEATVHVSMPVGDARRLVKDLEAVEFFVARSRFALFSRPPAWWTLMRVLKGELRKAGQA